MIKVLIFTLFAFLAVSLTPGKLFARNLFLTHPQFMKLSQDEKRTYAQAMMEFVVELETQYKKDIHEKKLSPEKFRKTTQILFKFKSFFFEDAYAAGGADWDDLASKYLSTLSTAGNNSICIFAGWPSRMNNDLCTHPSKTASMSTYQNTCGAGEVSCNPVFFGFKKAAEKTLFCVPSDDSARNSALECMKSALKDPNDPNADPKKDRLDYLAGKLKKNPAIMNQIYKFAYQTCLCEKTPIAGNSSYGARIRPHRTCYGLMNMMGAIAASEKCVADTTIFSDINTSLFTNLQTQIHLDFRAPDGSYDGLYIKYLADMKKDHPNEVKAMCPLDSSDEATPVADPVVTKNCNAVCTSAPAAGATADGAAVAPTAGAAATPTPAPVKTCKFKQGDDEVSSISDPVFGTGDNSDKVTIKLRSPTKPDEEISVTCKIAPSVDTPPRATTADSSIKKITLSTTLSDKDSDVPKVSATVDPVDAVVTWYRRDTKDPVPTPTTTTTTTTTTVDRASAALEAATTETATPPAATPTPQPVVPVNRGTLEVVAKETTASKTLSVFYMCAVATKTGYKEEESCQKIDPKDPAAAARNNPGTGAAQQMAPVMGGGLNSTINGGIR